jgi:hypothetical protein
MNHSARKPPERDKRDLMLEKCGLGRHKKRTKKKYAAFPLVFNMKSIANQLV